MCGEKTAATGAEVVKAAAVLLRALCRFCTVKIVEERNACYAYSGFALKFG